MYNYKKRSYGPLNFFLKPEYVYIPLIIAGSDNVTLLVKKGDYVYKGTTIARKRDESKLSIFSSVSGIVEDISIQKYHTNKDVKCVKIKNDFKECYETKRNENKNFSLTQEEFINILKKHSIIENNKIIYKLFEENKRYKSIIIDVKEIDPYITSSSILIKIHPDEILDTLDAILKITGSEECIILLDENDTQSINALSDYIGTYDRIRIEFNYKEKNSITLKIETIYAIYEAIKYDIPFMQKVITISGDGFKNPQNILVKNGTNAHELIESIGGYKRFNYKNMFLVSGDALKGKSMPNDNFIIGLESSGILAIKSFEDLEEKPCIRCGKCINICPQGLNPLMIIHLSNKKLNAQKCNECGLCSYICPSRIKIRDKIIKAKEYQNERIQRI